MSRPIGWADGLIRIEPDWNVKIYILQSGIRRPSIRIEPDWNVKDVYIMQKGGWSSIRIEPDWNVKNRCNEPYSFCGALE